MKRAFCSGILSAAVVAASVCARGQSNVYSLTIYSAGNSWAGLCSLNLPFPPYRYKLTEHSWYEDANGLTIMDLNRRNEKAGVLRRLLEIECGSNSFSIPLEFRDLKRAKTGGTSLGTRGSGDLALLVTGCVTNRGGHAMITNAPAVPLTWVAYSLGIEDVVVVSGDHFAEIHKFLAQAFGTPDTTIHSSASIGNARSITYGPQQVGVMLNLTADSWQTVISVVGKRKP